MNRRRAVFLDRDGTLMEDMGYLASPQGVSLMPAVIPALRLLASHRFELVMVTNQSGVGRGYFTAADVDVVNERLQDLLAAGDARLGAVYVCPHAPEAACACRKPEPGLLLAAAADHDLDLVHSYMVGDKASDVEAGSRAGCHTVLLDAGNAAASFSQPVMADAAVTDLLAAASWIVAHCGEEA